MRQKSRKTAASSIGVIDVIANGAAALLLLIVVSLGSQGEREFGSSQNEDDPIVLARQINPHIKLNNLPVQGPAFLLPYDELDHLYDTSANLHSIEVHESHIVLRDADPAGPVVIGRAELLLENNRFDAYLRRQSKDVLEKIRLELYELGLYHIVASIMIDNNAKPGRFRHSLVEENRSAPIDRLVIVRLSLDDERLTPAQVEEFRQRLARIDAALAQAREGEVTPDTDEALERLGQEIARALAASRNAKPADGEGAPASVDGANGTEGVELRAEGVEAGAGNEIGEQVAATGGDGNTDNQPGSTDENEVAEASGEPTSAPKQLRSAMIPREAREAAEQRIESVLQSARVVEPGRPASQSGEEGRLSAQNGNPDSNRIQSQGDGNDDRNSGVLFAADREQNESRSSSLVLDVWQQNEDEPTPAQPEDRSSNNNELRSLILNFADQSSRPGDDSLGLARQSQIGVFVITPDGTVRRELGTARVNSGEVGDTIEIFKQEIRREIFKDEFQTILNDKQDLELGRGELGGLAQDPSAADFLSNQDLKAFAEAVRELAISVKEEIELKQEEADAYNAKPGAEPNAGINEVEPAPQATDVPSPKGEE